MGSLIFHFCSISSMVYLMAYPGLCQSNFTYSDELALLAFKSSVRDTYNHLQNWSNSSTMCNWSGVTCDSKHERVRILSLAKMGLSGSLPSQIGNLSFLVKLDLNSNRLYGKLPKELLQLQRLEILNLSYNSLSGEIPSWIGSLFTLQHLILGNNSFGGIIPPSISNLSKLETLDLNSNSLQGSIPFDIGRLQNLKILRLSVNELSGNMPPSISNMSSLEWISLSLNLLKGHIPVMDKLTKLKLIYLEVNKLTGQIPRSIGNLIMLQELYLSNNNLKGDIPKEISNLTNANKIYLNDNQLSGYIPKSIGKLTMLQELSLANNDLEGNIPNEIRGLTNLKIMDLSVNQLFGHIPRGIGNLTMLQDLYLGSNNFEGSIPMEIGNLQQLEKLLLSGNNLSEFIPSEIFNISTLKVLSLSNNSLSGSLPSDFGYGFSNLQELYLWGNKLSGKIPNSISNASKLTILELEHNNFEGVLPSTLGHLRYLESLWVHYNNFTIIDNSNSETSFFSSLSNCRHLKTLILSNNPLHTKLPKSIGNLSDSLQTLMIDFCGLNGNIPSEIGNLSNLFKLSLAENALNGPIPTTIGNLQALQHLSLVGNELDGLIIDELCKIRRLVYLYLSRNKFSGAIPSCLGNLMSLQALYLGANKLISGIPSSFWNLTGILKVNLSSNMLVGNLSFKIGNMKALVILELSRNHISGVIPTNIGSLQNLQNFSLADNLLQGTIPESLGNLLSLVKLDLSQNNLSGEIPKSLESLTSLKYVNLSYNELQGEIPSGGVFKDLKAEFFMMNKALCGEPKMQVPPCRKEQRKRSKAKLILLKYLLPMVLSAILVVSGILLFQRKRRNSRHTIMKQDLPTLGMPRRISYFEILDATNRFDESNLLGSGSFGSVFQGRLSGGIMVAVKIFNFYSEALSKSFEVECDTMRNVRHRNLVKIISSCSSDDFKCLIMEFIPNGSLEKWLYSHNYCLDFLQRLNIIINIASALEYLHHGLSTPIVHCDLKPSNILLDDDMVAHVTDFGIAKFLDEGKSRTLTETIPTIGYVAPEYGSLGIVSTKVDVYSFGIILMEVFTRKRPSEDIFVDGLNLKSWRTGSEQAAGLRLVSQISRQHLAPHSGRITDCCSPSPQCLQVFLIVSFQFVVLVLFGIIPATMSLADRYSNSNLDSFLPVKLPELVPEGKITLLLILGGAGYVVLCELLENFQSLQKI
ncbi:putative receptor-like protein kinase At3g47110 [Neltuma alba]|uniref:putative receptor-like protein kinase At3g47110 n=1 Tax=Neltuma alba TaxID=207710 RepID=UPI0010A467F7|nr:putative receptor-like protein kinase At3g47110 [Prosopis alba]